MLPHKARRPLLLPAIAAVLLSVAGFAAAQGDPNPGTIKVKDEIDVADEPGSESQRNEPHVDCVDFWVEGNNMAVDNGTLSFFSWPPTGSKELVLTANWTGDWEEDGSGFSFQEGPFTLPVGHYRVEATNADGHTKNKMFWVDPCEGEGVPPEEALCPTDLTATVDETGITLTWTPANGSDGTNVYRALGDGDFVYLATVAAGVGEYVDTEVAPNTDYAYTVTGVYDGGQQESTDCGVVEVTTIPEFPTIAAMSVALVGGTLAYLGLAMRRKE